ncbi:hypothetical protein L484_018148 [Morus notabilis]|uniref:Uncharacterized protein n=1 Tax=Morus notabilis TaxID=981085 RepID=W9R9N5_9ROSA|nr:hypothetical protein L484_018148 [Morus notabilis]
MVPKSLGPKVGHQISGPSSMILRSKEVLLMVAPVKVFAGGWVSDCNHGRWLGGAKDPYSLAFLSPRCYVAFGGVGTPVGFVDCGVHVPHANLVMVRVWLFCFLDVVSSQFLSVMETGGAIKDLLNMVQVTPP